MKHTRHKSPSQPRIIPPDEDRRRLFQECKIGKGNASLLSEALAFAKPEDLKQKSIIKVRQESQVIAIFVHLLHRNSMRGVERPRNSFMPRYLGHRLMLSSHASLLLVGSRHGSNARIPS